MNNRLLTIVCGVLLAAFGLDSCDTPTGQGAAAGAGAGALIGGLTSGSHAPRNAAIGAAIGAATGALIGHAVQENRAREYGPPPPGGYPYARPAGGPGMFRSPYTGRIYDLRGVPPGGLTRDVDTGQLFRRP
ncbi:MAG TPA: YMGG-like glycine zipper-containing protein [Chthoniobacterales bacterium]|nr:YMGG-like glycine zipper-containing protein [Chthoniobacterales bacterium]